MKETWRWFGPADPIPLDHVRQAGATGIVSALHHRYRGEAWSEYEVLKRRDEIVAAGLMWSVVESIPIHDSIKRRSGPYARFVGAWKDSLVAVAKAGVDVVCYNFMPVVDWTRTDLKWRLPSTGYALRFDATDFAAYDLHILERTDAAGDYPAPQARAARARFDAMSEGRRSELERTIIAGLPGAEASYDREMIRGLIAEYHGMTAGELRANLVASCTMWSPSPRSSGCALPFTPMTRPGRSLVCLAWSRQPRTRESFSARSIYRPTGSRSASGRTGHGRTMISWPWCGSSQPGFTSYICGRS